MKTVSTLHHWRLAMDAQPKITADMQVTEMTERYPETAVLLLKMGVQCVGCWVSRFHTVSDVSREWNLDLGKLLKKLNHVADGGKP